MESSFSSECVSWGHPDRLCDTVANAVLQEVLSCDERAHVGIEALVTRQHLTLSGEVSAKRYPDYESVVRGVIAAVGYNSEALGFDSATFDFVNLVREQSPDIRAGVDAHIDEGVIGAGDQGIIFGYATKETDGFLPLSVMLANLLMFRYQEVRQYYPHMLKPDAKSQVTVSTDSDVIYPVKTIIMACSHYEDVTEEALVSLIKEQVIYPVLKAMGVTYSDSSLEICINTAGRFVVCGPESDAGVVGRKLVVDSYGGHSPIGGGCTNGKDPSKVDMSAARAARHAAVNLVAAGVCDSCVIQLTYAIGCPGPVSVHVKTEGLKEGLRQSMVRQWLTADYDFTVAGMIKNLELYAQPYDRITYTGQFGTGSKAFSELSDSFVVKPFSWERVNLVGRIVKYFRDYFGVSLEPLKGYEVEESHEG